MVEAGKQGPGLGPQRLSRGEDDLVGGGARAVQGHAAQALHHAQRAEKIAARRAAARGVRLPQTHGVLYKEGEGGGGGTR